MRTFATAFSRSGIALAIAALVGLVALSALTAAREDETAPPTNVVVTHPAYPYDFNDKRILVGFAQYVFLGEVAEQVGNKGVPTSAPDIEIPQTQFRVKVMQEIKGKLPPEVVVSQSSALDKDTGDLILIDGDPLLQPGEVILFVANAEPEFDWYTIVAGPFGATRAKDADEAAALVTEFAQAERHQFVPVLDPSFVPPDAATASEQDTESE